MVSRDKDLLVVHDTLRSGGEQPATANNVCALRPGDVVLTSCLATRPVKSAAIAAEVEALQAVGAMLAKDPRSAVATILDSVLRLCACGSAGISLSEMGPDGRANLRWHRVAGPLDHHAGTTLPHETDPCRLSIDANATILVSRPFSALAQEGHAAAPLLEGLFTPLRDAGGALVGTLWAVHHDLTVRFDAEDVRILEQMSTLLVLALKASPTRSPATITSARGALSVAGADANPFVRKLHGFVPLSTADRATLHRLTLNTVAVPAQTDLIREGDAPSGVFLVMEGIAGRYRRIGSGRRQVTAFLLPGDVCDLDVALLSRMDHTIMTLAESRVARLDRATVLDLTQNHPNIAAALRKTTLVDEATLREWMVSLGSRSALQRIAHLFCELQARFQVVGADADSGRLNIAQPDLADATGLPLVHVNRTLQDLQRQGLIAVTKDTVSLVDLQGLRDLTGFTGEYLHLEDRRPRA